MDDGTYILESDGSLTRVVHRDGYYVGVEPYTGQAVGRDQYVGVWTNPATGVVYRDVYEHVSGIVQALDLATERHELAIWDVARECEVLTWYGLQARVDAGQPFDVVVPA